MEPTNRGLKLVNPTGKDVDDYKEQYQKNPRLRYAAMRAHQEMAAQAIAVGATQKLAAKYAGISSRQVKKYYTDAGFRARIEELRSVMASKIKGKIIRELDRRTGPMMIKNMELLDLLRVMDRLTAGGKGMAIQVAGDVNVTTNYEQILASLFNPNPGTESSDFPGYEPGHFSIPGSNSPVD